jgi:hypothetical protein
MCCPRCQQENPPQAKFCLECGVRFPAACAQLVRESAALRKESVVNMNALRRPWLRPWASST